ncbi:MAG: tripartite tricarboxylate transporter TctB family protein [Proteobacteria bacterium]|nr:tripartite tricarboxylate transporter TctB family protein [Pseudomonadota bacterium]
MGKLTSGQWTEIAIWLSVAGLAFGYSFEFDREIDGYLFGASGWPRAIIAMIFLGAAGQFVQDLRKAKTDPVSDPGYFSQFSEHGAYFIIRMGLTLALPLVYAMLLQGMGYYFLTPFFLGFYLYLTGERRATMLIFVPLSIYGVITVIFTRVLYVGLPIGYWPGFYDFGNQVVILLRG